MARPGNTVQVAITIPKELKEVLNNMAKDEMRSFSNMIVVLVQEALKERDDHIHWYDDVKKD